MKKEIFQMFTIDNGIRLSAPVLEYISNNFKDIESVQDLLDSFKANFDTPSISLDQIKELNEQKISGGGKDGGRVIFELKMFRHQPINFHRRFLDLTSRLSVKPMPVSFLQEGVERKIFGIFFRNRNGKFTIEDDYGTINVDLSDVQSDGFLFDNVIVGMKGIKSGDFKVKELFWPKIPVYSPPTSLELCKNAKMCVFGCFNGESEFIKTVLSIESPELCIVSVKEDADPRAVKDIFPKVIICPTRFDREYIPFRQNNASNPFVITVFNHLIGFIDYNLFEHRRSGLVFNENNLESFLRAVFSQGAICPFGGSDFFMPAFPNIMIVSQNFHPLVLDIEGFKFVSLPPIQERCYAVLDFNNGIFEVKCL